MIDEHALDQVLATVGEVVEGRGVAGLSVAVGIGREIRAGVGGSRGGGTADAIAERTLFQAASVSKPVAAAAALRLASQGRLDLDADVNDALRTWKVPAVDGWTPRLTVRHLLTHSAGLTVHGFPGYPAGAEVPSVGGVLSGEGNTDAVESFLVPGLQPVYSGGGFTVLQQLLMDVTGREFAPLLAELVLEPSGMEAATFEQPLPPDRHVDAAVGHTASGDPVHGGWHVYPEQAAAGLWCTPTDLIRFASAIRDGRLLGPELTAEMLREQVPGWGLGVMLTNADQARFKHDGHNHGFLAAFESAVHEPIAVAAMTNSEEGGPALVNLVTELSRLLGWGSPSAGPALEPSALVRACCGTYVTPMGHSLTVGAGQTLTLSVDGQPPIPLQPFSATVWAAGPLRAEIRFEPVDGAASALVLRQHGVDHPATVADVGL